MLKMKAGFYITNTLLIILNRCLVLWKKYPEEKGTEYFEKYFTYTLLEYFGLSYDPMKIIEREQYWKQCFDTIKNGYNDN